jgi:hypothetical protein
MTSFLTWQWCRAYLVSGLVLLYLVHMVTLWLERARTGEPWWKELRSTFLPKKGGGWKDALITLLGFSILSIAWPVLALWMLINIFSGNASWRSKLPEAAFACQPAHLRKAVTQPEAETLGTVIDPLGRAPTLPFGHLNAGWLAFLGMEAEGFALWYFEVPCAPIATSETTQPVFLNRRGLAWVKSRKVKAEFVFEGN